MYPSESTKDGRTARSDTQPHCSMSIMRRSRGRASSLSTYGHCRHRAQKMRTSSGSRAFLVQDKRVIPPVTKAQRTHARQHTLLRSARSLSRRSTRDSRYLGYSKTSDFSRCWRSCAFLFTSSASYTSREAACACAISLTLSSVVLVRAWSSVGTAARQ